MLPGNEAAPLQTEQTKKQALYYGMPKTWRERFDNAPKVSLANSTTPELLTFFRKQEKQAALV
jgi:hypothetical protein